MGAMGWIVSLIGWLWRMSRNSWVDVGHGLRPRSGASGLFIFLITIFFLIGLMLFALGFDLDRFDSWLDAQGSWLDLIGKLIFKVFLSVILLFCIIIILTIMYTAFESLTGSRNYQGDQAEAKAMRAAARRYQGLLRAGPYRPGEVKRYSPQHENDDSVSFIGQILWVVGALLVGYLAYGGIPYLTQRKPLPFDGGTRQRQPSAGATCFRTPSSTWAQ
jgi:energy-coupling factor transporter transmembrane protein EcfT